MKRNTKNTRLTSEIPAQYLARLPIQTYARQFRRGSETRKTPGWEKRLMKFSPLQTEMTWKKFFDALKTVYGPQSSGTTPLLSADGTSLLTNKEAILKRWAEHFDGVLNRPSSINDEAINRLPQVECNPLLDELPTVSETVKAIKKSGKAPGSGAIPAEIYKAGPPVAEKLTEISHYVEKRSHPSRIQGCNNYPPIQKERESSSLWQSSRHLFIVNCWEDSCYGPTEPIEWTPESQCGFRKNRGTIGMIFTARQLQEKCQEQNVDHHLTFVDLAKAFDTVSREGLWKIVAKFGCPAKFIAMVRQFHDGKLARVQNDDEFSDPFPVTNGVK